jgi:prevent-host-death family protein
LGCSHILTSLVRDPAVKNPAWKLQDAKARFSEVVRRARSEGPQRVTVHGKDAVVVVAAEEFDRRTPSPPGRTRTGRDIVKAFRDPRLGDWTFEKLSVVMPVRDPVEFD